MKDTNDYVLIEADKPRKLRYGHKALKMLQKLTGKSIDKIDLDFEKLEEIEKVFYCGLFADDKDLTLEKMEDVLDCVDYATLMKALPEAITKAFGSIDEAGETEEKK
jgi:hypothetical protein